MYILWSRIKMRIVLHKKLQSIVWKWLLQDFSSAYLSTTKAEQVALFKFVHLQKRWQHVISIIDGTTTATSTYLESIKDQRFKVIIDSLWPKKGPQALHLYSVAIFVASWLKWLQMICYVSNRLTEVILIHLK